MFLVCLVAVLPLPLLSETGAAPDGVNRCGERARADMPFSLKNCLSSPCSPRTLQVEEKGYAVVVVAEGAGEELLGESTATDASGCVQPACRMRLFFTGLAAVAWTWLIIDPADPWPFLDSFSAVVCSILEEVGTCACV